MTDQINIDNILIVKAKFKAEAQSIYGQLLIIFNNTKKNIDSHSLVVSSFSDAFNLDINAEWYQYEELIADLKWKGHLNENITASLSSVFKNLNNDTKLAAELYFSANEYDYKDLDTILHDHINRIVHDKNLLLETVIQEVEKKEFEKIKLERSKPKNDSDKNPKNTFEFDNENAKIISGKSILSPVSGKPIYSIKIGDKLMVKITPNSDEDKNLLNQMELIDEDKNIIPTPAEIVDIKLSSSKNEPIEILTKLNSSIFIKIFEEDKHVKLKLFNPSNEKSNSKLSAKSSTLNRTSTNQNSSTTMIILTSILAIILSIFIGLILFFW